MKLHHPFTNAGPVLHWNNAFVATCDALQVLVRSGSPNEKRYAKRIQPVSCHIATSFMLVATPFDTQTSCGL